MHARVGDEVVKATPGCWVLKPRRIPHTMWNAGPEPARIIELYTPDGFELFFKDFGDRLRQGPIGLEEWNRLGEPHGIRFFDDWIPDLRAWGRMDGIGSRAGCRSSWARPASLDPWQSPGSVEWTRTAIRSPPRACLPVQINLP